MNVQKFMDDRILKSTEKEFSAFSYEKTVKAKVVSIDLETLTQTYLCSVCSSPVSINNAWCVTRDNVSSQSQCKSKEDLKMVTLNGSGQLRSMYHTL